MPLKCLSGDKEEYSFRHEEASWGELRRKNEKEKHLRMPCCDAGVVLKKSSLGTLFFAHEKKGECVTEPETAEHLLAKDTIARALGESGLKVETEHRGKTPEGEEWVADVWCEHPKKTAQVAFEVQWSRQTDEETKARQERYKASGVRALWLMRQIDFSTSKELPVFRLVYSEELKSFEVWFLSVDSVHQNLSYRKNEEAWSQKIPLPEFVRGALGGKLKFAPLYGGKVPLCFHVSEVSCWKCRRRASIVAKFELAADRVFPGFGSMVVCLGDEQAETQYMRDWLLSLFPRSLLLKRGINQIDGCGPCGAVFGESDDYESLQEPFKVFEEEIMLPSIGPEGLRRKELERWWFGEKLEWYDIGSGSEKTQKRKLKKRPPMKQSFISNHHQLFF